MSSWRLINVMKMVLIMITTVAVASLQSTISSHLRTIAIVLTNINLMQNMKLKQLQMLSLKSHGPVKQLKYW